MWPAVVVLVGLGIGVLGLVDPDMYVVGILVVLFGGIGVLVRAVDWLRWIRRSLL